MALQKFAKAIMAGKPIQLYNYGNHRRDFTYIDDIVEGIIRVLDQPAQPNQDWQSDKPDSGTSNAPWRVYNIGSNNPVELKTYVSELEKALGKTAEKELLPLQPGDVPDTYADVDALIRDFDYKPSTTINEGIETFVEWFKNYYR
jgi:UDP-glucuronate 4-epimerase